MLPFQNILKLLKFIKSILGFNKTVEEEFFLIYFVIQYALWDKELNYS